MALGTHRIVVWGAGRSSDWGHPHTPEFCLASESPHLIPAKGLVVKPCLLTLEVFGGRRASGKWGSRLGVKVYISAQSLIKLIYQPCSRSRAAWRPHMIRTGLTWIFEDGDASWRRLRPRVLSGWTSRALWDCCPWLLFRGVTPRVLFMIIKLL